MAASADIPSDTPTLQQREAVEARLAAANQSDDTQAALFVLEQSKASYDAVVASNTVLEAKASSLLTMIAGAAGLFSLFGHFKDGVAQASSSLFLWLAIGAAVAALVSCLYILRTKVRPFPSAAAYVLPKTEWDDNSRFQIALELAESYNSDIIFSAEIGAMKGRRITRRRFSSRWRRSRCLSHFAIPPFQTSPKFGVACRFAADLRPNTFSVSCMERP